MTEPTLTVPCPACFAPASAPCTAPTDTGRREVRWLHVSRLPEPPVS